MEGRFIEVTSLRSKSQCDFSVHQSSFEVIFTKFHDELKLVNTMFFFFLISVPQREEHSLRHFERCASNALR